MKRILVTGGAGQDGFYLRETFDPAHRDSGLIYSFTRKSRVDIANAVHRLRPDECYHLAAFHRSSQAGTDRDAADSEKKYLGNLDLTHELLSALREHAPHCKTFLAGSCHQFGLSEGMQGEYTRMNPTTMYGITKLAMMQMGEYFVRHHGMFVATGILFNHESPRRGPSFITSRLARAAARGEKIEVGNLYARVDWGFAGDYVKAMRLMLQQRTPSNYVISSGELHSVREFAQLAYEHVGHRYEDFVTQEPVMHRPVSNGYFGDSTAIRRLGWAPTTSFQDLVRMMVDSYAHGNP